MNYARNQLIGSVVDKSTKKAFNWCSQKLTRQTINKVSKDTNKVAERLLFKNGINVADTELKVSKQPFPFTVMVLVADVPVMFEKFGCSVYGPEPVTTFTVSGPETPLVLSVVAKALKV